MEYKAYDEYKDSEVEYIRKKPINWELHKIKYNNIVNPNKSELKYQNIEVSFIPMEYIKNGFIEDTDSKNINEVYNGYTYFKEGDILLAKVTPCFENGNIGIAKNLINGIGFGTTEVHVIRVIEDNRRFIYYLLQSENFKEKGKSIMYGAGGLKRISSDFLENYIYPRPSYNTQYNIASFLDEKTDKIDKIISKKETLIEKLEEYKKSVITEAVTKGKIGDKYLNEDGELVDEIEMKDSGVDWIGEIPKYYDLAKAFYIFKKIGSGSTPDSNNLEYYNGDIKWLLTGDLNDSYINKTTKKITKKAYLESSSLEIYPKNSIVIAMYGATIGKLGILKDEMTTNQACCVLINSKFNSYKLYFYWLLSKREILISLAQGGGQPNINQDLVKSFKMPIMCDICANKIMNYLNKKSSQINKLINQTKKSIEKYKKYKKSLIFEAVTGKIDLRDYNEEGA